MLHGQNEVFKSFWNKPSSKFKIPCYSVHSTEFRNWLAVLIVRNVQVPSWIKMIAPKGSMEIHEEAWNAYPYCKTVLSNPGYMKVKILVENNFLWCSISIQLLNYYFFTGKICISPVFSSPFNKFFSPKYYLTIFLGGASGKIYTPG